MKILVVLSRVPYPLEKGDKLRAYHQIRLLSQQHDLYVIALHDEPVTDTTIQHLNPFCKKLFILKQKGLRRFYNLILAFFKGLPLQCGYFYSKRNQHQIDRIIQEVQPDRIYCQLFRMAEYVRKSPIIKTIDYQDVFSKGIYRRYAKASFLLKPFYRIEYQRIQRYEEAIFHDFDRHTIITGVDRALLPVQEHHLVTVVPNGVDFEQFSYQGEPKKYDLIFSGNMNYAPNIDAAEYLAKTIFPELKKEFPNLTLVLCGATPNAKVKALRNKDIVVTGWVDSMTLWYAQSKIFIAPMRLGTGLQNKLLEAMSMQLPCITSPLAGNPLAGAADQRALITCHNDREFISAAHKLLTEQSYYKEIANIGETYVRQNYSWDKAVDKLNTVLMSNPEKEKK